MKRLLMLITADWMTYNCTFSLSFIDAFSGKELIGTIISVTHGSCTLEQTSYQSPRTQAKELVKQSGARFHYRNDYWNYLIHFRRCSLNSQCKHEECLVFVDAKHQSNFCKLSGIKISLIFINYIYKYDRN